jgi:hypothetical protein
MSRRYSNLLITGVFSALFFLCTSFNFSAEEEKAENKENTAKTDTIEKADNADNVDKAADKDSLMNRIDFGNSYIMGQSIKSGAVYLLHRKKSNIKSMLKTRDDYRKEILEELKVVEKK